jgi:MFS family permease
LRDYIHIARKITLTLFFSQSFVTAGLISMATVSAIVGAQLSGDVAWAGVPSTVVLIAAALGAVGWGFVMERIGRRKGLVLGLASGVLGSAIAGGAILAGSFIAFLCSMVPIGMAQAAMQLGRFTAAEVHPVEMRGRAIANVVLGGTVGSILGPLLVGPSGRVAASVGWDELAGPYGIALIFFSVATFIAFYWLKPDPTQVAQAVAQQTQETAQFPSSPRAIPEILRYPAVIVAVTAMVIGQMVMVMLMVITSLFMRGHEHSLTNISLVITAHTFGMFAFSIVSGRLADRLGRELVILMGAILLIIAGLTAGLSTNVLPLATSLFLLGLGWNFCYVGGSTFLADQLTPLEQSRMQGINDLLVGLASALGSLGSGFVFASTGYRVMGIAGAILAFLPLILTLWLSQSQKQLKAT